MKAEIRFRQIDEPLPPGWVPRVHWQVECYDGAGRLPYPMGTAWVSDFDGVDCVTLDYVLVADWYRRQGVATLLVQECRQRWPNIHIAEPLTADGVKLLASLQHKGIVIEH